ncbi:uncharacterized protein LTR77_003297 [Saxophila tyrrhenica]|uniref:Uncharacterized protein n=1 Tax=Saxophila tyrrhenica TaxID=1690608 RepID=A0AAV9PLL3_9PEZI|nr:hypothetical protein LTR77_003297 [Saxophila tyrrhenica]
MASHLPKGLLDLPRELRDEVWFYALHQPLAAVTRASPYGTMIERNHTSEPPLCRVNKQIRDETLDVFYGGSIFAADLYKKNGNRALAYRWAASIGNDSIRRLQLLVLSGYGGQECRPGVKFWNLRLTCHFDFHTGDIQLFVYVERGIGAWLTVEEIEKQFGHLTPEWRAILTENRVEKAEDVLRSILNERGGLVGLQYIPGGLAWLVERFAEFCDGEDNPILECSEETKKRTLVYGGNPGRSLKDLLSPTRGLPNDIGPVS